MSSFTSQLVQSFLTGTFFLVLVSTPVLAADMLERVGPVSAGPADEPPMDNTWLWAKLWSDDPAGSASFDQSVVGYKSKSLEDASGDEVLILGHGNTARPWGHYPGYIGRPIDPDWGVDAGGPVATPLPEMGMPDMGGMDMGMGMDMGGFDF